MTNVRPRVVFGVMVAILGAAMFLVVSAFALDHVSSKIVAAIAGGIAFPLAPVVWHLIGERRRTSRRAAMKVAPKTSLTGGDRFWMRFAAVVLVVIGPMVAIARFGVVRSVWHHGLWFVPEPDPAPRDLETLFKRVPSDADLVVAIKHIGEGDGGVGLIALGNNDAMATIIDKKLGAEWSSSGKLDLVNSELKNQPWLPVHAVDLVSTSDDSLVVSTPGWHGKVESMSGGLSPGLRREFDRAPKDAAIVIALAPHDAMGQALGSGVLWVTHVDDKLVLEARGETSDDATAAKLVTRTKAALRFDTKDIPESCRDPVSKIADQLQITHVGSAVTIHAEVPGNALMGLLMCAMSK